eukprot:scaffold16390_cov78-Skeletonema_dohrnii-CCMP3373.AAC.2
MLFVSKVSLYSYSGTPLSLGKHQRDSHSRLSLEVYLIDNLWMRTGSKEELAYHTTAIAEHRARVAELGAELAAINEKQKGMQCMLEATVAKTLYIEDLCFIT